MPQTIGDFSATAKTQRTYARLAGFLFPWLIITGIAGLLIESHITGSGTFAEAAKRVAASQHLYRIGLCIELIETMSALVLAFALYVTLKPFNLLLAQHAMYWRLGESLLGAVGVMFGFSRLDLYGASQSLTAASIGPGAPDTERSQALLAAVSHALGGSEISAIFFSIGSLLFFYLFFKSRCIPRILSAFGVFASVVVTLLCFGSLVFPEHSAILQYGWAPMAIAEVSTGVWLMIFAVKTPPVDNR
jgi:hypothetical protein